MNMSDCGIIHREGLLRWRDEHCLKSHGHPQLPPLWTELSAEPKTESHTVRHEFCSPDPKTTLWSTSFRVERPLCSSVSEKQTSCMTQPVTTQQKEDFFTPIIVCLYRSAVRCDSREWMPVTRRWGWRQVFLCTSLLHPGSGRWSLEALLRD